MGNFESKARPGEALTLGLHGVGVELHCDHPGARERIAGLFAAYAGVPGADPIRVELAAGERAYPVPTHARRILTYGKTRSYRLDGRHWFTDYFSTLCVEEQGALIRGNLSAETLRDPGLHLFTDTLLFLSLFEALRFRGLFYLHASAVEGPDGTGYLISGNAGSGKTSLTLSLIHAGFKFLSDDTVFLHPAPDGGVHVLGFARDFHVARDLVSDCPEFQDLRGLPGCNDRTGKLRLRPDQWFAQARAERIVNPRVLLFPTIVHGKTELRPLPPQETFAILMPQSVSVMFDPRTARPHLEALRRVIGAGTAFRVLTGPEIKGNPRRARELAEQARDLANKETGK